MVTGGNRLWQVWRAASRLRFRRWRTTVPISQGFGFDRGQPIDRYYIDRFLTDRREDVRGRVLEVGDDRYTRQFGSSVDQGDVLHAVVGAPGATLIGDLVSGDGLPDETFDCIIATQTLHVLYDVVAAAGNLVRMLKPGGTLLLTVPGISQVSRWDSDQWGDYWRFTAMAAERVMRDAGAVNVNVVTYGNVLAASAFLHGLAADELRPHELDSHDRDYQVLVAVQAKRSA